MTLLEFYRRASFCQLEMCFVDFEILDILAPKEYQQSSDHIVNLVFIVV